jgi:RNA polymerase sigma-70 factor (ECF subfamily)
MLLQKRQSSIASVVIAAQQGDNAAMGILYDRSFRFCYKRLKHYFRDHNTICDMISEVWLVVLKKLHRVNSPGSFFSWLKQVNRSCACNHIARSRLMLPIHEHSISGPDHECIMECDQSELLDQLLSRMCYYDREVIGYFYFDRMPIKNIAKKIRCPAATVKRRLFTARNRLRKMIASDPACRQELLASIGVEE